MHEFYGDSLHHNDGENLTGGVPNDASWKIHWRWLAAQSDSWYSTPPGKVVIWFTEVLDVEWRGVLDQEWNYKRTLVILHVVLTKTLGNRKAREIRGSVNHCIYL